jgi:hypothetical protein
MNNLVIKLAFVFLLGILPPLASLLILRKIKQRWQARLRRARLVTDPQRREDLSRYYYEDEPIDLERYAIGDTSCHYNARSPYIRCAVNPSGPCTDCPYYKPK